MRPSARFAAVTEILDAVLASNRAADRLLADWQRGNRYAGAKDRRAISELVYQALREQGIRRWRLEQVAAPLSGRSLALADPALSPDDLATLFDGGPHAPAALDSREREWLSRMPDPETAPLWARINLPPELTELADDAFGPDLELELAALNQRAPLDLRVNTIRATRIAVLEQFQALGIAAAPTPFSPLGIRLERQTRLDTHPLFLHGDIEPQDEAAQLAGLLLGAMPNETVVDLCAGAGGKTLLLAAQMRNRGRLIAGDQDSRRLDRLKPRLRRAGVSCVEMAGPDQLPAMLEQMAGRADRVFLDVPCSGSGVWRRNPEARWRFGPAALDDLLAAQAGLLAQGAGLLRPGGTLVYATCSIFPIENQHQLERFLQNPGPIRMREVPLSEAWQNVAPGLCPLTGDRLSLSPYRHQTDGFFAAVLQRLG